MTSLWTYSLYFPEDYLDEEKDEYSNDENCDETADDFEMHVGLVFRCWAGMFLMVVSVAFALKQKILIFLGSVLPP